MGFLVFVWSTPLEGVLDTHFRNYSELGDLCSGRTFKIKISDTNYVLFYKLSKGGSVTIFLWQLNSYLQGQNRGLTQSQHRFHYILTQQKYLNSLYCYVVFFYCTFFFQFVSKKKVNDLRGLARSEKKNDKKLVYRGRSKVR